MPFLKHIIILFLLNSFLQARTFTSSDGVRKIEASITSYDEKTEIVSIVRNDGKSFNSKLSSFSANDQAYVLKWLEGTKENYLYVGKEYPGHLQMYLKILNSGGIGYGQTILYRAGMAPVIIGNGTTPFLAWVDGYNKLDQAYGRFNATSINFDLIEKNWRASISFQVGRSFMQSPGVTVIPSGNLYGLPSVSGPILYQQPQRIVIMGKNPDPNAVLVLPRGPAPVFINPYTGGMNMNGVGINGGGYSGDTRTYSRGSGISVRINR
jgi:hypothetical protein